MIVFIVQTYKVANACHF